MRVDSVWKLVKPNDSLATVMKKLCGDKVGYGLYRDVYILKGNDKYVVKVERDMSTGTFANVTEWRNYINNADYKLIADWLAPCHSINHTGQILIQKRVTHKARKFYPKYIPDVLTDTKLNNFGWIGEKFVCCDYSFLKPFNMKKKLKYAKWWRE